MPLNDHTREILFYALLPSGNIASLLGGFKNKLFRWVGNPSAKAFPALIPLVRVAESMPRHRIIQIKCPFSAKIALGDYVMHRKHLYVSVNSRSVHDLSRLRQSLSTIQNDDSLPFPCRDGFYLGELNDPFNDSPAYSSIDITARLGQPISVTMRAVQLVCIRAKIDNGDQWWNSLEWHIERETWIKCGVG